MTSLLPPGPHGGDAYLLACALEVPVDEVLDLSASLNPLAHDPTSILARHLDAIGRYPDDQRATAAVAEVLGVDAKRLVLTNGGAEAIALVAAEHPIGSVDPFEFSLYAHHLARSMKPVGHPGGHRIPITRPDAWPTRTTGRKSVTRRSTC